MSRPNFDEIAKITRDLNYAYIAGYKRLIGKDDILALKGGGDLKLYETVAQDDQVKSCVQQRISAVISRDWGVEPGDDSKPAQQAAEFIEQELKNLQWDRINEKMLWGSFYGYSVGEIMWRRGDKIGIDDIKVRNRRRFNFGTDLQPKLITIEDPLGEDLPDQKFWHFCCGGDNDDDPYGRGLAHWLYWPTFFKRSDMRWWVTFLEKYAQPTRLGKYSPGASESDKDTLWQAMDAFGTNGKMMIPEGTMIELLEAARAGGADYQGMLDICNAAISKIVLSQTMTTDNGSSESQANVHQDVKDDIVKADADLICSSFNEGPVKWLIDWNFPGVAYPRVWRQMDAAVDLTAEADRDTKLQGLGISLKPESIAAKYGDDYLIPDNKEQIPQLNGEQVNALVSIVSQAKQGGWSPELVAGMINGAFPNWPDEAVAAITKNLGEPNPQQDPNAVTGDADPNAQPVDPNTPKPQTPTPNLNDVAATFGEAEFAYAKQKEGTTKVKNGVTYVLTNSRWKRAEPKAKSTGKGKTKLSDKSKAAVADVKAKSGVKSKKSLSKAITDEMESKPKPEDKKPEPSGLVLVPKKPEKETQKEEPKVKKTIQEQINDKYSSESPTDDDAKSWLADTIEARNNPTPENVESRTTQELARQSRRYESGVDTDKFSSKIVDRKSYALAAQAMEQWEKKKYPDLVENRTDPAHWLVSRMSRGDGLRVTQIPSLEKKLAATKSEATKKTISRQLASLKEDVRREPEVREQSMRDAAKWSAIYSSSKADRIKQLEKDFDAESSKTKTAMEATYADIKAGKKSAIEDATNDAGRVGGVKRYAASKPGTNRPISTDDIKDRLRELGSAKSEEMFSVGKKTTKADIRQQYRALAGIHHPDKGGSPEKFRSLNDAYNKIMEKLN